MNQNFMRYNRPRRDKFRNNDRGFRRNGSRDLKINSINHVSDSLHRRSFNRNDNNPEKLLEKYNTLAKEASSKGDKTLSENYYQHADHFLRIVENQNSTQNNSTKKSTQSSINSNSNNDIILEDEKKSIPSGSQKTEKA